MEENYISQEDLTKAESYAAQHKSSFTEYLLAQNLISAAIIGQAVAESFGVAYADLNTHPPQKEQILLIPEILAKKFQTVVFAQNKNQITLATDNPKAEGLKEAFKELFPDKQIIFAYSPTAEIERTFSGYSQGA